jgi:hypothetical protein
MRRPILFWLPGAFHGMAEKFGEMLRRSGRGRV